MRRWHTRALIVDATDLPVSADLEKGFGDTPEVVAETIRLAAGAGLVGCTIEDATGNPEVLFTIFVWLSIRIAAAAEAARALPFPFILTARAHNLLYAAPSLDDTIGRLQAFEKAGADVLFAPACLTLLRCAQFVRRCRSLSILWWGSKENHFRWANSPRPESGASASRPRSIARQ